MKKYIKWVPAALVGAVIAAMASFVESFQAFAATAETPVEGAVLGLLVMLAVAGANWVVRKIGPKPDEPPA